MSKEFRELKKRADQLNRNIERRKIKNAEDEAELQGIRLQLQALIYEGDNDKNGA